MTDRHFSFLLYVLQNIIAENEVKAAYPKF